MKYKNSRSNEWNKHAFITERKKKEKICTIVNVHINYTKTQESAYL